MVATMPRPELRSRVGDGESFDRNSVRRDRTGALLSDDVKPICMVFLAEDEVPGEVRHQADMAGDAKLPSRAHLTERSGEMVEKRVSGKQFGLIAKSTVYVSVLLIKTVKE